MPSIPRYSGPQVDPRNAPSVRTDTYDTGQQALAQGAENLGKAVYSIGQQQRQQEDESALMAFENQVVAGKQSLLSDPENGASVRKGKDAIGLSTAYLPEWEKRTTDLITQVPGRLRARAEQIRTQHTQQISRALMQHELQQSDAYHAQTAEAGVKLAGDEALLARTSSDAVNEAIARALMYGTMEWKRQGLDSVALLSKQRELSSSIHAKVLDGLLQDDPTQAEQRLTEYRKHLTAADQIAFEEKLRPTVTDRTGYSNAMSLLAGRLPNVPGGDFNGEVTQIEPSTALARLPVEQRRTLSYNDAALNGYAAQIEQQMGLPPGLINAIKNHGERSNSNQTSPKGARGVMQFMPASLKAYGVSDASDPLQMIEAAGRYLRDGLARYGSVEAAIADYNGGPKAAAAVLAGKSPPAQETRDYLKRVRTALGGSATPTTGPRFHSADPESIDELVALLPVNMPLAERQSTESHLRNIVAARKSQRERQQQYASASIYDKVTKASPTTPLTQVLTTDEIRALGADSTLNESINRYRKIVAEGGVVKDDEQVLDSLYRLRFQDPAAFRGVPLAQYADKLSGKTLIALSNDQAGADLSQKGEQWATEAQLLGLAATDMGISGAGNDKERAAFNVAFYRQKRAWMDANKKEPSADELQQIINRLKLPMAKGGWWGTKTQEAYAVGPQDGYSVPAQARAQIIESFRAEGTPTPSEAQIREAYLTQDVGSKL